MNLQKLQLDFFLFNNGFSDYGEFSKSIKKHQKDFLSKSQIYPTPEESEAFIELSNYIFDGSFRVYVDALIRTEKGILLIKRSLEDDFGAGKWAFPGGKVDPNERVQDALKREIKEEIGLNVETYSVRCVYKNEGGSYTFYFECYVDELDSPVLDGKEIASIGYVNEENIDSFDFLLDLRGRVKEFLSQNDPNKYLTEEELDKISREDMVEKSVQWLQDRFDQDLISPGEFFQLIEKARSGVYADNAKNRKLKRVGQKYGSKGQGEAKEPSKKEEEGEKKYSEEELKDYAKNSSKSDLERIIKEGTDPEKRKIAAEELARREKEEVAQEETEESTEQEPEEEQEIDSQNFDPKESLSKNEYDALYVYTASAYRRINSDLRSQYPDPKTTEIEASINSALNKMPKHKGITYRGESLEGYYDNNMDYSDVIDMFQSTDILEFPAFTSTSSNTEVANDFKRSGGIFYEIESKGGADISSISEFPEEEEVLFKSKSRFRVLDVDIDYDVDGEEFIKVKLREL